MPVEEFRAALAPLASFFRDLTHAEESALSAHIDLLLAWNRKMNLTAVRDFGGAVRKHVGESLFVASHVPLDLISACDIGSGGGFPGIPLAIVRSEMQVTLVESDVRKSVFLREASRGLKNIQVVTSRFEQLSGRFDCLVSRAVNLSQIRSGPECRRAAVLAGRSLGENAGLLARYRWSSIPVPWERGNFLWLGDVSRETSNCESEAPSGL